MNRKTLTPEALAIDIRPASPADAPMIAALSLELGYPATVGQVAGRLQAVLGHTDHAVFVARLDNRIVGWLHVFLARRLESEPFAELGGFVVHEAHRRRGIGRRLLAAAEGWSTGCGAGKLRVRFRSGRQEARSFYRELGFLPEKAQDVHDKILQNESS